jgi:hypothetical protein
LGNFREARRMAVGRAFEKPSPSQEKKEKKRKKGC